MKINALKFGRPAIQLQRLLFMVMVLLLSGVVCGTASGQGGVLFNQDPHPTAAAQSDLGYVDTSNGNLHIEIPLGSFPQRGSGTNLTFRLVYDSAFWTGVPGGTWGAGGVPKASFDNPGNGGGWHEMMPVFGYQLYPTASSSVLFSGQCDTF